MLQSLRAHPAVKIMLVSVIVILTILVHTIALVFIVRYTTTFPLAIDEWIHAVPRVLMLENGELTPRTLMAIREDVPLALFGYSFALMIPSITLLGWNLLFDSFTNYGLMALNTLLALILLTREGRGGWWILLLPITAVMISTQQRWNLIVSVHNGINLQVTFVLLSFVVISLKPRLSVLLLTLIVTFFGTFASSIGWMTWGAVLVALWFLGYRKWWHIALWLVAGALTAFVLFNVPGFNLGGDSYFAEDTATASVNLGGYVLFLITYLGSLFTSGPTSSLLPAFLMGGLSIIIAIANIITLYRVPDHRRYVAICLMPMIYGGGYGVLAALGRYDQFGVAWGAAHHYIGFSSLYWVGVVGLVARSITVSLNRTESPSRPVLPLVNSLLVLFATVYYGLAVVGIFSVAEAHKSFVTGAEMCIVEIATNPNDERGGCLVVGGYALTADIRALYAAELTGFHLTD